MAYGISQIKPEGGRPVFDRVLQAQKTVDEHARLGDVTQEERGQLRFLIAEVMRMNRVNGAGAVA